MVVQYSFNFDRMLGQGGFRGVKHNILYET